MKSLAVVFLMMLPAGALANDTAPSEQQLYAAAKALPMPSIARKLRADAARFRAARSAKGPVVVAASPQQARHSVAGAGRR